jgi:hypothetical protein
MSDIVSPPRPVDEKIVPILVHPIRQILTQEIVEHWCKLAGHAWRARVFTPLVTLMACVARHLQATSVRQVELSVAPADQVPKSPPDGSDFCQARVRLPLSIFQKATRFLSSQAQPPDLNWRNRTVYFVDGTTVPAPRTATNGDVFGFAPNQRGRSVLPVVRLLLLVSAATGAVMDSVCAPFRFGELRMLRVLFQRLPSRAVLVGDALFSAYWILAAAALRDCHFICPPQKHRKLDTPVKRLGWRDELHCWRKPDRMPAEFPPHLWNRIGESMQVRVIRRTLRRHGYRDRQLILCTTLLDPQAWPAHEIVEQYLQRWNVELDIRTLKAEHGLARLRTQTPAAVMREIQSALLAHNVVRCLMSRAGPARSLSHTQCLQQINFTANIMVCAPLHQLRGLNTRMLKLFALCKIDPSTRPPEPRAVIHRGRPYRLLRGSRTDWRDRQRRPA